MGAAFECAVAADDADIAADRGAQVVNPVIRPLQVAERFRIVAPLRGRGGVRLVRPGLAFGEAVGKQAGKRFECIVDRQRKFRGISSRRKFAAWCRRKELAAPVFAMRRRKSPRPDICHYGMRSKRSFAVSRWTCHGSHETRQATIAFTARSQRRAPESRGRFSPWAKSPRSARRSAAPYRDWP